MLGVNIKTLYTNRSGPEPLYLLTQRSPDAVSAPNAWSLIGGTASDGEAAEDAAYRLSRERVGLDGHDLRCVHEWVQQGLATTSIRSLWIADTTATVTDLVSTMQAANFYPLDQIPAKVVTDTTKVALHLALPELIRTIDHTALGVLFDLAPEYSDGIFTTRPDTSAAATELSRRGLLSVVLPTYVPGRNERWPSGALIGGDRAANLDVLRAGKPNPALYRVGASRLGLDASQCVCVSTDRLALIAASAAGAIPVRLTDSEQPEQNEDIHTGNEPWPVIDTLSDLPGLLPDVRTAG